MLGDIEHNCDSICGESYEYMGVFRCRINDGPIFQYEQSRQIMKN